MPVDRAGPGLYNAALFTKAPVRGHGAQVAQLVEHATENRSVGGSIPPLGTNFSMFFTSPALLVCNFRAIEPATNVDPTQATHGAFGAEGFPSILHTIVCTERVIA
jgi:hypothetical protein